MPKIKEFMVRKQYVANYGYGDRSSDQHFPVNVSNYNTIKAKLSNAVADPQALRAELQSEFIYPDALESRVEVPFDTFETDRFISVPLYYGMHAVEMRSRYNYTYIENPRYGCGQRDTYTYSTYRVAPVLEELLVHHKDDFRQLLSAASDPCKQELLNFTNLDLSAADLSNLDLSAANFSGANLQSTPGVTQALLDQAETYVGAQLPKGMIPFWTDEKKNNVLKGIAHLEAYGKSLLTSHFEDAREKGRLAVALANELTRDLSTTKKYNGAFQTEFLSKLHRHDDQFNEKRFFGLKMIIANIALCILGVGIGYVAAGLAHQHFTGRFLFFSRTATEESVADIQNTICPAVS